MVVLPTQLYKEYFNEFQINKLKKMSNKVNLRNITPGGANTSVVSPITTTYEGSFAGEYIAAAILSGNTLASDVITIKPNVKYKQVVKKLDRGS